MNESLIKLMKKQLATSRSLHAPIRHAIILKSQYNYAKCPE